MGIRFLVQLMGVMGRIHINIVIRFHVCIYLVGSLLFSEHKLFESLFRLLPPLVARHVRKSTLQAVYTGHFALFEALNGTIIGTSDEGVSHDIISQSL